LARANHTGTQLAATVSDFDTQVRTNRLDQMAAPTGSVSANSQKITNLATATTSTDAINKDYVDSKIGAADGIASLDAGGKVPASELPDIAISDTSVVVSEAAMLALTAEVGDIAVRTDVNKTFILKTAGASTLANWQELLTPTDAVTSVDGQTGVVDLSGNYVNVTGDTMSGALAMGTNKITGLGTPTVSTDAATKDYVDTAAIAPSNLTGVITSVGPATSIASQTGTGSTFVVNTSPTLVTPVLGVATATSINGTTIPSTATLVTTGDTTLLVPSQTGESGKYLTTDGTVSSWDTVSSGSATYYQTSAPIATAVGELWVDSDATASQLNTNDFVQKTSIYSEAIHPFVMMGA
jgi:hypothetical protein